ncbi:hypothetical protein Tco_1042829 [Tanacetum coccineum]|uniref:Copia protein n=1 Tax=Tanacetum coccineum TaxID=301880 RepID=A0ABQ5GKW2_9ASTR
MSQTTERQEPKSLCRRVLVSDSGDEVMEKVKDETCLVAHASSEVCFESSYFSDENSSIDDIALDNEYDKLYMPGGYWEPNDESRIAVAQTYDGKIEESLNMTFDGTPPPSNTSPFVDDDLDEDEAIREIEKKNLENNVEDETLEIDECTTHLGLWYPKGTGIETVLYVDSDHAGDYVDRKSTSGICTFMGCCLTFWFSKKQTALAISTTEAEYVSAGKA